MTSLLLLLAVTWSPFDGERVEFGRDVRPILSQACYPCHGPDDGKREAGLRLDRADVVHDPREILVPGSPSGSELYYRITTDSSLERMPPETALHQLTSEQVDVLRRWIEQGASYEEHWSFQPIRRPEVPAVRHTSWPVNAIDHFVLERLEGLDLGPADEADRRTLIRRLTLDLTGLPPTLDEIATFVADSSPDAVEKLVDRLLASPAYAERMTLAWMDAARYGDTSVFHADGPRSMWPWRDWVLDAYEHNLPFDEFTLAQLAGDLVPGATLEQRIATGFIRNNGTSDEGGAIDEELRVSYMIDRVKTTGNVWLGLSTECAQCHEHKYDPISQRDYYRLFAFFNQSVEKGFQTRQGNAAPVMTVPAADQGRRLEELETILQATEGYLSSVQPPALELAAWAEDQRQKILALQVPTLTPWQALGPLRAGSSREAFQKTYGPEKHVDLAAKTAGLFWESRDDLVDGAVHALALPNNSALYLYRTIHVDQATTRSASFGSDDTLQVWLNGESLLATEVYRAAAADQNRLVLDLKAGPNRLLIKVVNGGGQSGVYFKLLGLPVPDAVAATLGAERSARTPEQLEALRDYFVRNVWSVGRRRVTELQSTRNELTTLQQSIPTVMVMEDLPEGRPTYLLDRGQYDAPKRDQSLEPGVLEFLLPMPNNAPRNRLGLAQWLIDPDHPLTARVAVNRYWAMLLGTGLVGTVMDFGSQGEFPSHPQLLDWLAAEFIASGWNVKHILKLIVLSSTYRQSSHRRPELTDLDPRNRMLGRAPRFRLQGEFIRDQALAVSGLLVDRVGGPGVRPYQPPGLWNEVSLDKNVRFARESGEALYRRSMYIYWKRSAPMPAMTIFDAPTREKCVVQRQRTNTPLQALVTLNDVQFVEAARHLAERMMRAGSDFKKRLDHGFERCTGRPADERRRTIMRSVLDRQLATFRADPAAAAALVAVGDSSRDESLEAVEHAAWTVIASMLLNLDETLNRE